MTDDSRQRFVVKPIGFVESNYRNFDDVPHGHNHDKKGWTEETFRIVLLPEHAKKLQGLEGFSHIVVVFWIHKSKNWRMPEGHKLPKGVKVFATRMPKRPNPIGVSVVQVSGFCPRTGTIDVMGLDCLDKTPVLDIKPYLAFCDSFPDATVPDWVGRKRAGLDHHHAGRNHETERKPAGEKG